MKKQKAKRNGATKVEKSNKTPKTTLGASICRYPNWAATWKYRYIEYLL